MPQALLFDLESAEHAALIARMCAILDRCNPGWFLSGNEYPAGEWSRQVAKRRRGHSTAESPTPKLDAAGLVAQHLADCLPGGAPSQYREIVQARYRGTGRKRVAIADLLMFDGLPATVEVFRWGPNAYGHHWTAMEGGACFFEDGRWQRVEEPARA